MMENLLLLLRSSPVFGIYRRTHWLIARNSQTNANDSPSARQSDGKMSDDFPKEGEQSSNSTNVYFGQGARW